MQPGDFLGRDVRLPEVTLQLAGDGQVGFGTEASCLLIDVTVPDHGVQMPVPRHVTGEGSGLEWPEKAV